MDEKEFLREKEKLKEVSEKLEIEEKIIENNLSNTSSNHEKDSYVRAQLVYVGNKKLKDLKKIKDKPYFARIEMSVLMLWPIIVFSLSLKMQENFVNKSLHFSSSTGSSIL